jgi:cystathionine beta-lyase
VTQNGRKLVTCPLVYEDRKYSIDFQAFQETIAKENIKMFILCSPHNPVGRVWTPLELQRMGKICEQAGVIVVSDEIHCEFIAPGFSHNVFAGLDPTLEKITVTLVSPSKTFNLSGLQISHVFIEDEGMRHAWLEEKKATGYGEPGTMGLAAAQAAYEGGRQWLDQLLGYINKNEAYVLKYLQQYINTISPVQRQGTYLLWLDCQGSPYGYEGLNKRLIDKGRLWLSNGATFGIDGEGFQRLNLACPMETLTEAMLRMAVACGN